MAKAGDVDASAAKAVKSGSAEPATERGSAETTDPAPETANRATPEATTPRPTATEPAAAQPANMPTGEPPTMSSGEPTAAVTTAEPTTVTTAPVTTAPAATVTTAPAATVTTASTPAREGINRRKRECSTDRGGDGNSDDCFSKHGKFPLWNDLPDRNNLVAAAEQRLNVNITIARSENGLSHHCAAEAPGYLLQRHPRSTQVEDETENVQRLVRFSKFSSATILP